jgi:hypothetical protein
MVQNLLNRFVCIKDMRQIVKIILSTSDYLFDKEACLQSGAHAYFIKPPNYAGLIEVAFSILALYK